MANASSFGVSDREREFSATNPTVSASRFRNLSSKGTSGSIGFSSSFGIFSRSIGETPYVPSLNNGWPAVGEMEIKKKMQLTSFFITCISEKYRPGTT